MMVPSLSTSISSPALFKNRENGGDGGGVEDDNNIDNTDDQLEQLQNQVNNLGDLQFDQIEENDGNQQTFDDLNFGESADIGTNNNSGGNFELQDLMSMMKNSGNDSINSKKSNSNGNKEGLNDLFISSINVDTLLDDLDQLSDNHSQASVSSGTNTTSKRGGGYDIKTQRSVGTKGGGSSSSGSSPRSNSLRVYRTFPYRGDHHSYSQQQQQHQQQQQQQQNQSQNNNNNDDSKEQEKPKPSSTNGIRHSRKYKGLQQLDFLGTMIIDKDNNNNNNNNSPNPINDSQEVPIQQQQYRQPLSDSINNLEELNNIINNNNNNVHTTTTNTTNTTNTTQWSELIESLGYSSQSGEQKTFGSTLDDSNLDLKDLIVDGIPLNLSSNSQTGETDFSKIENLNQQTTTSPPLPSVDVLFGNNNSSSIGNDLYPDTIEIQQAADENETTTTTTDEDDELSKINAVNKFQQNLNLLNTGMGGRVCQADSKKKQLSRTITFSDPSSIYSFFNGSNSSIGNSGTGGDGNEDDAKVPNSTTTTTTTTTTTNVLNSTSSPIIKMDNQHRVSEQNRTSSKISLSTLFPTLPPFNSTTTPPTLSPSKYYFPLLQPTESTALIRGFSAKADINKRGLKRAKKPLEMEDEWFADFPFGGTDESIGMFAIFDGHSGKNCAVAAKQLLPDIIQRYIQSTLMENGNRPIYDMRGVLLNAFKEVDAQLSKFEYEGATATVVLIWKPKGQNQRFIQSANVGDSTAFLSYGNETLFLSKDHRATDPEEIQRIKNDGITLTEGQTRINGLMVSRALGDHFIKHLNCGLTGEPYVSPPIPITPFHSHLIVASDGLWDVISGHRAMEIIKLQPTEDKMSNSLIQCSLSSVKCKDNVSLIVVSL